MAQFGKLVNKQFNSPINLYSDNNIREVLDRESQRLDNGAVGINFHNPAGSKSANLQHSAVLRFLEEEEARKRGGNPSLKRVAWPPPPEAEGHLSETSLQEVGGPQISSPGLQNNQAPSANYQHQGQERPQLSNQHQPVVVSPYKPTHQQVAPPSPSYQSSPLSPLSVNASPAGFSPVHQTKHWAPVHSPITVSPQPKFPTAPQQQHQYQPPLPPQQYQPPSSQLYQQYQSPLQQYQPAPQQYQPPSQQYQPTPQQYQSPLEQYQPPSQQYQSPSQQYQPPPQQYHPAPQQYQPPHQQYQPPPQQYQPAPQQYQYQPPPQQYQLPPQQYQPPSPQHYQPPSPQLVKPIQQSQTTQTYSQPSTPQQPISQPQFQAAEPIQPQLQQQHQQPQTQAPQQQYQQQQRPGVGPQQHQQQQRAPVPQPQPQVQQTVKPSKAFEPPPSTITLRPEAPVSQAPAPLITSQPATATLKGGKNLRGDLKWPPPETKAHIEEENRKRLELARGPVCRPRKVNKDYSNFFAQHALNNSYPGYKIPPGTQFYVREHTA